MRTHRLAGLEDDNLLAFLALLGLLRALSVSRVSWSPRAFFDGTPMRPLLRIASDASAEEIATAAAAGCSAFAAQFAFGEFHDLTFDGTAARRFLTAALRSDKGGMIASALCSDAAVRENCRIEATPLCAMFGQGHQSFLDRLHNVSAGELPRALKAKKSPPDLNDAGYIFRALFSPWQRKEPTESFRWDFEEDRRYALRFDDPSGDPATTEHGANRLAILGLLSFQTAPRIGRRGARITLGTRGVSRGEKDRRVRITWPIWSLPTSMQSIHAMLDLPELGEDHPPFETLSAYSIRQLRRVRRISNGKYISFT
ncbi:MAG: type I-G CRISPR-associated protein, Cas3-extension family, partial [Vulcanimicrobiaceae bacterium]